MGKRGPKTNGRPETVTSNLDFLIKLTALKNAEKIDISDPVALKKRISDYFEFARDSGHKPTLSELAIALGINRNYIYMIVSGNHRGHVALSKLPAECVEAIKDGYNIICGNIESMLASGEINPVSGIFLAKNMGLKDTNEMFDSQTQKEIPDMERLKTQYLNQLPDSRTDT